MSETGRSPSPGEVRECDVKRFPLTPDPVRDIEQHRCCWCVGAEGATVCHAAGHAEAVALSAPARVGSA